MDVHSCKNNRKINRLYERCLRIVYNDKLSSFSELLTKDDSAFIQKGSLQILAAEMYKVRNYLAPPIVKRVFLKDQNPYI